MEWVGLPGETSKHWNTVHDWTKHEDTNFFANTHFCVQYSTCSSELIPASRDRRGLETRQRTLLKNRNRNKTSWKQNYTEEGTHYKTLFNLLEVLAAWSIHFIQCYHCLVFMSIVCVRLTDRGAVVECWLSTVGGLGVNGCGPCFFCRVGIGGEGSLQTWEQTTTHSLHNCYRNCG